MRCGSGGCMDKKVKKEVERIEGWTHAYVVFGEEYVHLHGDFTVEELRLIAGLQKKKEKEGRK